MKKKIDGPNDIINLLIGKKVALFGGQYEMVSKLFSVQGLWLNSKSALVQINIFGMH